MSAYKLSHYLKCKIIFDDDCIIQEKPSLRKIGHARAYHSLYVLDQDSHCLSTFTVDTDRVICNQVVSNEFSLWQHRVGHPSHNVVKHICTQASYIHYTSNKICDSCHVAKQHRLPFPLVTLNLTMLLI